MDTKAAIPFIPVTLKATLDYTDWVAKGAVTNSTIDLFTNLPGNIQVIGVRVKQTTQFAGTGVTNANLEIGDGTTAAFYAAANDCAAAVAETAMIDVVPAQAKGKYAAGSKITAKMTIVGGGNLDALTAGVVEIWVVYRQLQG